MSVCLEFDPVRELFVFSGPTDALKIPGVSMRRDVDGSRWALPAWLPAALPSLREFKKVFPSGKASPEAMGRIEVLKSAGEKISSADVMNSCGFSFKVEPYAHQVAIIEAMLWNKRLAILAEMGTGKTFMSLNYIEVQKFLTGARFPTIVLAPKITLRGWEAQATKFTNLSVMLYKGTKKQLGVMREQCQGLQPDILLTNYEALSSKSGKETRAFFKKFGASAIIMDEGSRLKGWDSARSKSAFDVAESADRRYILSGTLCLGNPEDVYNPFSILYPPIFGSNIWSFRKRYVSYSQYNKHIVTGYRNLEDLKARINPFFVSLKRNECLELPDRVFSDLYYDFSKEQEELYAAIIESDSVTVGGVDIDVSLPMVKITKLMQVCSGFIYLPISRDYPQCQDCPELIQCVKSQVFPFNKTCKKYDLENPVPRPKTEFVNLGDNGKLEAAEEYLAETPGKAIVFAVYVPELEALKALCAKLKRPVVISTEDFCEEKFESAPENAVFLGQVSTCIGITLNSASKTLYYSLPLNLEHYQQSLDRNMRIGQRNEVTVTRLLNLGYIDDSVSSLLEAKENVQDFLQTKHSCVVCKRMHDCMKRGISLYDPGCIHTNQKQEAEAKCRLGIK